MQRHHQDQVKVAVYSASMSADNQQRSQDLLLATLMIFSALTTLAVNYLG